MWHVPKNIPWKLLKPLDFCLGVDIKKKHPNFTRAKKNHQDYLNLPDVLSRSTISISINIMNIVLLNTWIKMIDSDRSRLFRSRFFWLHQTGSTIVTLLHEKINPKNWYLVLSVCDTEFSNFLRVGSSDYTLESKSPIWKGTWSEPNLEGINVPAIDLQGCMGFKPRQGPRQISRSAEGCTPPIDAVHTEAAMRVFVTCPP